MWLVHRNAAANTSASSIETRPNVAVEADVGDLDVEIETTTTHVVSVAEASLPSGFSVDLVGSKRRVEVVVRGIAAPGSGRVRLSVPVRARVTVHTRRGDVTIVGLQGEAHVSTLQGDISVGGSPTRVEASTTSGDIRVVGVSKEAELSTVSGDVRVAKARGRLEAETISGGIAIANAELQRSRLSTISGDIGFEGGLASGEHTLDAHSGNISAQLDPKQGVRLSAQTFSGVVEDALVDPPIRTRGRHVRQHRDGAARLELATFSGDVRISPRPAG